METHAFCHIDVEGLEEDVQDVVFGANSKISCYENAGANP